MDSKSLCVRLKRALALVGRLDRQVQEGAIRRQGRRDLLRDPSAKSIANLAGLVLRDKLRKIPILPQTAITGRSGLLVSKR
jgi:hypothetical protein